MMHWCRQQCPETPISVEIEKPRDLIQNLFESASLILFSKQYALSQSAATARKFCQLISSHHSDKTIICAWGDSGAGASSRKKYYWQDALKIQAVDTLAAGDVFNAGIIDQHLKKSHLKKCLEFACQLAGLKCTKKGIGNLLLN